MPPVLDPPLISELHRLARRARVPSGADRLLLVFSDIEMGGGGPHDDFPHTDLLADLLLSYNDGPFADLDVDLIFNGDTFDLLKTPYQGTFPHHITQQIALGKLQPILEAHPRFFEAVGRFLDHRRADRRVHFITGNHDPELAFDEVQAQVRARCGGDSRISFPGLSLELGRVHVEHGSQQDVLFQMHPDEPFVEVGGQRVLNLSSGSAALLDAVLPLTALLYFHDRLKPKERLFQLVPSIRDLLTERLWAYWTRDFWKNYFRGADPIARVSWTMLKEVFWRLASKNMEILSGDDLARRMRTSDDFLLYVLGHKHQSEWTSFGDRKILQAGCLRNEYMLLENGDYRAIPKCYVEVFTRDGAPIVSEFVEFQSPPAPEGYLPRSIFEVVPEVQRLLESMTDRERSHAERTDQEELEQRKPRGS